MAVLVGMSEEVKGRNFDMNEEEITLGRASDNTIPIDSGSVSGHHCRIVYENGTYILEDLGSTNGTRINARKISNGVVLKNKNIIQVGAIEFLYENDNAEMDEESAYLDTDVEIDTAAAAAPKSFTNISPFNTRKRESKGIWYTIMILLILVALGGVGWFVLTMLNAK